jgi:hypothetical protein
MHAAQQLESQGHQNANPAPDHKPPHKTFSYGIRSASISAAPLPARTPRAALFGYGKKSRAPLYSGHQQGSIRDRCLKHATSESADRQPHLYSKNGHALLPEGHFYDFVTGHLAQFGWVHR